MNYKELVKERKRCRECANCGLVNPSIIEDGKYDSDEIGPWTRWQGSLSADIMIVGQDWGSQAEFSNKKGLDRESNPTDVFLTELIQKLEIDAKQASDRLFLTNAALCIREGKAQGGLNEEWLFNCRPFLKAQIDLIKPKILICLGQKTFYSVLSALDIKRKANEKYRNQVGNFVQYGSLKIFPVYHPGGYGLMNRTKEQQIEDWLQITQNI